MDFNGNEVYKRGECPVCGFEFSCSNNTKYCFYCGAKTEMGVRIQNVNSNGTG